VSALDAVEAVLAKAGTSLDAAEITRRAMDGGLWATGGRPPVATINARLAMDIKRRGPNSRFQRTAKGRFALRAWALPEYVAKPHLNGASAHRPASATQAHDAHLPAQPARLATQPAPVVPRHATSFAQAAEQVLDRFGGKKPMHYRDITMKALELGLISTAGQTPEATLYAQVLTNIARRERRGEPPRFVKHGRGYVGLARWLGRGLASQIEQHNTDVRRKLHTQLQSLPPATFEELIGQLLASMGFEEVAVTGRSGDGGIDVRGMLVVGDVIRMRMAVQVKRWKNNVQAPTVQQVRGALGAHEQGLIITTSNFSQGARHEAERPNAVPVGLMHGEQLVALLVEHDIGVHRTSHYLIELGEAAIE